MTLSKINYDSPKLPQLVAQTLINAIESGQIQVGQELPSERDMAEMLGVSRGPLRECLAILEFLGAIQSGAIVRLFCEVPITSARSWPL